MPAGHNNRNWSVKVGLFLTSLLSRAIVSLKYFCRALYLRTNGIKYIFKLIIKVHDRMKMEGIGGMQTNQEVLNSQDGRYG